MVRITLTLLVFAFAAPLKAQLGNAQIGLTDSIGITMLANIDPGRGTISRCLLPQQCETGCAVYVFFGKGSWEKAANWQHGIIPPKNLSALNNCYEIWIQPTDNKPAVMLYPQTIGQGGKLIVDSGRTLIIPGDLYIKK